MVSSINKRLGFAVIILLLISNAYCAYLKNVPQVITQPDGTVIHCFASGDEFHNWLHDSAGFTIIQDKESGYYVYATLLEEKLIPSKHVVGAVNPQSVGLRPDINISDEMYQVKRAVFDKAMPTVRNTHKSIKKNEGTINNIAIFIRFADDNDTLSFRRWNFATWDRNFNDTSANANSMYNYFKTVSYDKMHIKTSFLPVQTDSNIVLSYKDTMPRMYYKPWSRTDTLGYGDEGQERKREIELLKRVIAHFQNSIPSSVPLDYNNDGKIDNICFIITGSTTAWSTLLWPHRTSLYTERELTGTGDDDSVMINGKRVYDYNFLIESHSDVSTNCHEMMHTLSAPDLYHNSNSVYAGYTPVGGWCLMASNASVSPQGLSAYIKHKYGGWIESIPDITGNLGTYTLYPANGTSPEKTAYIIRPSNTYEFLVLEYRSTATNGFDKNLSYPSGLVIYRINENNGSRWPDRGNIDYNGTDKFDQVYVYRPGGVWSYNLNGAAFHSGTGGRTSFGLLTDPYPFYQTANGYPEMDGILITNIKSFGDSMQFTLDEQVPTFELSRNNVSLYCTAGATNTFTIKSNTAWTIANTRPDWLNFNPLTGRGNTTVTVTALSASENRSTEIMVSPLGLMYEWVNFHQSCLGIDEKNINTELEIFPNPASEYISISYPQTDDLSSISIYSIKGELLYNTTLEN